MPDMPLSGRRIFVVEDEYFLADELSRAFAGAGAAVLGPVATVDGALRLLADRPIPDAAILDVNLGGKTVYPVADALLARGVPFLFTTGYDQATIPSRYASTARLEKPMNVAAVLHAVGRLLVDLAPRQAG